MPIAPVDTAIVVRVGPAVDDTDFKTRETVAFGAAGITVGLHKSAVAGTKDTFSTTAITPEDPTGAAGNRWQHIGGGYHELEITAGQNNTEGELQVVAIATGVLHFESAVYTIVPVAVYNSLVAGTDTLEADVKQILGTTLTETEAGYLAAAFKKLFDVATPLRWLQQCRLLPMISRPTLIISPMTVFSTSTLSMATTTVMAIRLTQPG